MPGQFALPGLEEPPRRPQETKPARREPPPHSLFFAVMPAPADLTHIGPAAAALRRQHGMTRGLVKDERLHVTC